LQQQIVEKREEEFDLLLKQCVEVLHFSQIVEKRIAWGSARNCSVEVCSGKLLKREREREAGGSATFVSLA
jgi:hypothetical protein